MFVVNDDLSIYATRGDIVCLNVSAMDDSTGTQYEFQAGDIVRMKIFGKKDAESIYLSKDFPVVAKTYAVGIMLTEEDTKIGDVISKPMDYWYEIELNPYTNPQTIVGYDEDGAKVFKLFPEGKDIPDEPVEPEVVALVDKDLDLTSSRPVENRAIARAVTLLKNDLETVDKRLTGKIKENKEATNELTERFNNLIALENTSLSQNLEYLETVSESMKAKVDGRIDSDGVFAKVTVNLREANLFYGGTELELFVVPEKCCPSAVGIVHSDDGLEYYIRHDGTKYYMVIRGQSGVTTAPSSAGTVTFTYGLYNYEVKDIRVGANGKVYATAGEAIRAQLAGVCVTPQMFGAVGDGVADDSEAIASALKSGKILYLPSANYYCPGELVLPKGAIIVGNQSTLIDCVLCANEETDIRDIRIAGSGYIAISTEKVGGSFTSVSLRGLRINTSAETAILFECGGEASRYIYNVNIDDVLIGGAVNYGIRFKNNYNEVSTAPWITCVNVSNVFVGQFKTAILFDYDASEGYSFDSNRHVATNSLMSFTNIRGQWVSRSEHFVDCQIAMSNVHFVDSYPVDYKGSDGKRMFHFNSRRFKNTDLYVTNVSIDGANYWASTLFDEVEIVNTTNKVYDFAAMFCLAKEPISTARLMEENPYISTTHLKKNSAVIQPVPADDWKEQDIAKAFGVGLKLLASDIHGGDAPVIGGNVLGYPIISTDKGVHLILSGRYMPVFYGDNPNYKLPSDPCVGYMVFNYVSHKPMWWTGSVWVYADGSIVGSDELS